jgi:hypothetical protein
MLCDMMLKDVRKGESWLPNRMTNFFYLTAYKVRGGTDQSHAVAPHLQIIL